MEIVFRSTLTGEYFREAEDGCYETVPSRDMATRFPLTATVENTWGCPRYAVFIGHRFETLEAVEISDSAIDK